jgi:O-antigen/teichoic acid export membrane protein
MENDRWRMAEALRAEPKSAVSIKPVQQSSRSSLYQRSFEWGQLISSTALLQVAVQGLGFASGILIIRLLTVEDYAVYTLANTMLGTLSLLADGGISNGVMAEAGKVWRDPQRLGSVLNAGIDLRRKFALFAMLLAGPPLFFLLSLHGVGALECTLIGLAMVPTLYSSLTASILQVPLKLSQRVVPLQVIQVCANTLRLALSVASLVVFPLAWLAIAAAGVSQVWANRRLEREAAKFAAPGAPDSPENKREILRVVSRMFPSALYYCVSAQISLWLISVFGSTDAVAQVGALGRVAMLFGLLTTMISILVVPRFARLESEPSVLRSRYLIIVGSVTGFGLGVVALAALLPDLFLMILGGQYQGLRTEMVLTVGSAVAGVVAGASFSMNAARGLVAPPAFLIPVCIVLQVVFILVNDVGQASGVIMIGLQTAVSHALLHIGYFLYTAKSRTEAHIN